MLTIRKEQMQALNAAARQGFEDRMVAHLREAFVEQFRKLAEGGSGDERVRVVIRQGIEKAAGFGIGAERDVAQFIEIIVQTTPNFEEQSDLKWARAILHDRTISGPGRLKLIVQQLQSRGIIT